MAKKQEIRLHEKNFEFVWTKSDDGTAFNVNAYFGTARRLVMEWAYPKVHGIRTLAAGAAFWMPQAVIQADNELWSCIDCHRNTHDLGEYYMVHDEVWEAACPKESDRKGILCLSCLAKRLGRPLMARDFTACQANVDCVPVQMIVERQTPYQEAGTATHRPAAEV